MSISTVSALALSLLIVEGADRFWDTDASAPLVGSGSTLNIGGAHFSTAPSGDTALTTIGAGNDIYFQTDSFGTYTVNLDSAQTIRSMAVANGNDVTLTISDNANTLTCSNTITVSGGSSLTLQQSNALILDAAPRTDIVLGAGDNTFTLEGNSGSSQFWLGDITGDAGDRIVFDTGSWIRSDGTSVFSGELVGSPRLSPGTMTLIGDNPNFTGSLEGGAVTLGDGGTNGAMGSGRLTALASLRFNRSDDYTFTNEISTFNHTTTIANDGIGSITILENINVGNFFPEGSNVLLRGNVSVPNRLWFSAGAGTWTFAGVSNSAGGNIYNPGLRTSSGSDIQIGDGTTNAIFTADWNCQIADNSDLIMNLTGGAQLTVTSNLVVGTGCNLVIIGGGQEAPIISCSNSLNSFDNVIYNGKTYTWAEAQVMSALTGYGGRTQLRIDGNDVYIDPLPPRGTVIQLF